MIPTLTLSILDPYTKSYEANCFGLIQFRGYWYLSVITVDSVQVVIHGCSYFRSISILDMIPPVHENDRWRMQQQWSKHCSEEIPNNLSAGIIANRGAIVSMAVVSPEQCIPVPFFRDGPRVFTRRHMLIYDAAGYDPPYLICCLFLPRQAGAGCRQRWRIQRRPVYWSLWVTYHDGCLRRRRI